MLKKNGSSSNAIMYLLIVVLSFAIMHVNHKASIHYHREAIRSMEGFQLKDLPKQPKERPTTNTQKIEPEKADSMSIVSDSNPSSDESGSSTNEVDIDNREFFEELLSNYIAQGSDNSNGQSRTNVVIRYYKKSKDGNRVYKLRDLGFYIHERSAEDDFDQYSSNAIFYGDSVKKKDLVLIAYVLMSNGLTLQSISLSKYHDAWKAHSVEIGTDTTALDEPAFTLSSLRKTWEDM